MVFLLYFKSTCTNDIRQYNLAMLIQAMLDLSAVKPVKWLW